MSAFTVLSLCGQCTLKISCPSSPPYMLMFNPSPSPYLTVAAVPVLNTPDDGRLRPKHVEWPCRDKNCTVLHQVGFYLTYPIFYHPPSVFSNFVARDQANAKKCMLQKKNVHTKSVFQDPNTGFVTNTPLEVFTMTPGKRYRFRLINSFGTVCPAQFSVEGHVLTVIATDGEPVQPVNVNTIISFSGQCP